MTGAKCAKCGKCGEGTTKYRALSHPSHPCTSSTLVGPTNGGQKPRSRQGDGPAMSGERIVSSPEAYARCGMSSRAASKRSKNAPPVSRYQLGAFLCVYCGVPFAARVLNRPVAGRYCSHSCREMAYQQRKRRLEKREAARAAILAAVGR